MVEDFRQRLFQRGQIESAVGLLASRHNENIATARARLQCLANSAGASMATVADVVLSAGVGARNNRRWPKSR